MGIRVVCLAGTILLLTAACSDKVGLNHGARTLPGKDASTAYVAAQGGDDAGPCAIATRRPVSPGRDDAGTSARCRRVVTEMTMDHYDAWLELLRSHVRSHPEAEAVDLYKFLHQGVLGPGHMIGDRESATGFLHREIAGMPNSAPREGVGEQLLEALDPAGDVLRVHLRPFLAAGGDPDSLAEAFIRSASAFDIEAGQERLVQLWKQLLPGLTGLLADHTGLESLDAALGEAGYPAVRHSEAFRGAYSPAYRVVLRRELLMACPGLLPDPDSRD